MFYLYCFFFFICLCVENKGNASEGQTEPQKQVQGTKLTVLFSDQGPLLSNETFEKYVAWDIGLIHVL